MIRAFLVSTALLAAAPVAAENFYGAIAYSVKSEKLGRSWNFKSEAKAVERALAECKKAGGANCQIAVRISNSCGAFAASKGTRRLSDTGISWGFNTHEDAKARAVKECKARGRNGSCTIQTSSCNFGK